MGKHEVRVHTKVTRQEWLEAALAALEHEPLDQLRVQSLAKGLDVSRSSFYWYFESPEALQTELLAVWERNTTSIVERTKRETETIVASCLGVFECWTDPDLYHSTLDLAVRDWGRRDGSIAARVAAADVARLQALALMFERHGFESADAVVRARLLYHSQVGYYALGTNEPLADRLAYLPYYLEAMTSSAPTAAELEAFTALVTAAGDPKEPSSAILLGDGPDR